VMDQVKENVVTVMVKVDTVVQNVDNQLFIKSEYYFMSFKDIFIF